MSLCLSLRRTPHCTHSFALVLSPVLIPDTHRSGRDKSTVAVTTTRVGSGNWVTCQVTSTCQHGLWAVCDTDPLSSLSCAPLASPVCVCVCVFVFDVCVCVCVCALCVYGCVCMCVCVCVCV